MKSSNKDIFRQLEENILENEKLRQENRLLLDYKAEALELRSKVKGLESSINERIMKAVDEAVAKATAPLVAKISEQQKEILRLKAQINKSSENSSKPPSTDGFKKIPNNREPSGNRHGGQFGHKGTRLNIPPNLDELETAGKAEHNVIYVGITEGEPYVSDWEIDLKIIPVYTEYRRSIGTPQKISYGNNFK